MTRPLVSACMIMRDEEAVLEACLASLDGVVDEIVIVDTGSADRSVDLALAHGVRILHRRWDNDFATPRNLGLDHATGEWILYIDADERLTGADRSLFERLLVGAREVAFRILLRPESRMTPYFEYRLWRNDPRIRFRGAIHERVVDAIHSVAFTDRRPITDCFDVLLEHVGYEGDQRRKHLRNLPMLEGFVHDHPEHMFARHHLATVLAGLDRADEAESVLEQAVAYARAKTPRPDRDASLAFAALIGMRARQGKDFETLLGEALRLYPDNAALLFMEGETLSARGEYGEALSRFDAILEIAATGPAADKPAYDRALIGRHTHAARGFCLFKLGRYAAAADAYAAATQEAPDDLSYALKHRLALSRVERGFGGAREGGTPAGRLRSDHPAQASGRDDGVSREREPRETNEEST